MLTFINVQVVFFNLSYLQEIENCPQSRSWDVLERRRLMKCSNLDSIPKLHDMSACNDIEMNSLKCFLKVIHQCTYNHLNFGVVASKEFLHSFIIHFNFFFL